MPAPEGIQAATLIFSLAAKAAMVHQVRKNWKKKTCEHLSVPFFLAGLGSYVVRVVNGLAGGGWGLVWGELPGIILCMIIAGQAYWYDWRKRG